MSAPTRRRRWLRRSLVGFGLLAALWLMASFVVGWKLTRRARPIAEEPLPPALEGRAEVVRLTSRDGEHLGAWFLPGRPGSPVVLVLHGNGRSRSDCLVQATLLQEQGCPALLVTLRAHGDSTGARNDFGYSARHDVVAGAEWLEGRHPGRAIVVWGQSLGSAAALFAAEELGGRLRGYVLACPYQDLRTAVRNRTRVFLPPGLDLLAYTGLVAVSSFVLPTLDQISPRDAAAGVPKGVPVLILAGTADQRARPEEARAIAERMGHAEVVVVEGGDHSRLEEPDPQRYRRIVAGFLTRTRQTNELKDP